MLCRNWCSAPDLRARRHDNAGWRRPCPKLASPGTLPDQTDMPISGKRALLGCAPAHIDGRFLSTKLALLSFPTEVHP